MLGKGRRRYEHHVHDPVLAVEPHLVAPFLVFATAGLRAGDVIVVDEVAILDVPFESRLG